MDAMADSFVIAATTVADLLARPEVAAAWDRPSALASWKVSGLAGHLGDQCPLAVGLLGADESDQEPITLDGHYRRAAWVDAGVDDVVSVNIRAAGERNAAEGLDALRTRVREAVDVLPAVLAATRPDRAVLIPWQGWALRRDDFLTVRMMEITVHSDDLAASVGIAAPSLPDEVLEPGPRAADPTRRTPPRPVRRRRGTVARRASARGHQRVLSAAPLVRGTRPPTVTRPPQSGHRVT